MEKFTEKEVQAIVASTEKVDFKTLKRLAITFDIKYVGVKESDLRIKVQEKLDALGPKKGRTKKVEEPAAKKADDAPKPEKKDTPPAEKKDPKDGELKKLKDLTVGSVFRYPSSKVEITLVSKALDETVPSLEIKRPHRDKPTKITNDREMNYEVILLVEVL